MPTGLHVNLLLCPQSTPPLPGPSVLSTDAQRPVVVGAANNQLIMVKRPVDVVDLTWTDVLIDLTSDSNELVGDIEPLRPVKSKVEIPWMSKLPKHDPSSKIKVARRMSAQDNINMSELRKDAAWFEKAEQLFNYAMPP